MALIINNTQAYAHMWIIPLCSLSQDFCDLSQKTVNSAAADSRAWLTSIRLETFVDRDHELGHPHPHLLSYPLFDQSVAVMNGRK